LKNRFICPISNGALPQLFDINGAPRPMKMGTTSSRFPYDAAARDALQLASLRCSAI
jgi:hypothetical protein